MKSTFVAALICAGIGMVGIPVPGASAQEKPPATDVDGNIQWVFDYEEGKQISEETGKPMFVVFRCER